MSSNGKAVNGKAAKVGNVDGKVLNGRSSHLGINGQTVTVNGHNGHEFLAEEVLQRVNGTLVLRDSMIGNPAAMPPRDNREATEPTGVVDEVLAVSGEAAATNSKPMSVLAQRDCQLIHRCLAGDVSAWSEIYREFHDSLLVSIRRNLNRAGSDANLVEEIAARVWYSLIKNGFDVLAKFDVSRGCRLSTYLSIVAKNEIRLLFRSERRRRSRERLASKPDITFENLIESDQLKSDGEFLVTLSGSERAFFLDVLVASPTDRKATEQRYSNENNWQLRHRIRKKLELYISGLDEKVKCRD